MSDKTTNFSDVGDFHRKFGLPVFDGYEHDVPADLLEFRESFLREELDEFSRGVAAGDPVQMFDALLDLVYVAMGTAHVMGFPWQEGWDEVQRSNMEKVRAQPDGSDSKRLSAYDVVKPEGWEGPKLEGVLATLSRPEGSA